MYCMYVQYLWKLTNDEIEKLFLKQIEISSSFIFWRFSYKDHILIFVEKLCLNQLHRKQKFITDKRRSFCKSRTAFIRNVRIGFITFKVQICRCVEVKFVNKYQKLFFSFFLRLFGGRFSDSYQMPIVFHHWVI